MTKNLLLPGILWGAFLILTSCAQTVVEDPEKHPEEGSFRTVLVTGRFEGFPDYKGWAVYMTGFNYRSVTYKVERDGAFHIKATNVPKAQYRLIFGKERAKNQGSMKFWVDSPRTHLGVIKGGE